MINSHIFRAYDIRGVYNIDLTKETSLLIGRGVGTYMKKLYRTQKIVKLVVGKDNRIHGEELQQAFIEGLLQSGCDVTNIHLSPSPLLYFSVIAGNFDGGINVTASHNPKEYNGYKIVGKNAHSICGEEIQEIRKIIETKTFAEGRGQLKETSFFDQYIETVKNKVHLKRNLKIVMDAANGVAGSFYPEIFRAIGCNVIELYCDSDGSFPNHEPDPIVEENLEALKKEVRKNNADMGIAFDGDGDRVGIVDEKGEFHDANQVLILLARDIVARQKTNVIYTVSCSSAIQEEVEKLGGKTIMVSVGHSYVETSMREYQALLGGEQSGHFFISENYFPFDDACYTGCQIVKIISSQPKKTSKHFATMPKTFAMPEARIDYPDNLKFELIRKITREFSQKYDCLTLDGVRIDFGEGAWGNIRASNTSPKISVTLEARTKKTLRKIEAIVWETLNRYNIRKP